MSIKFEINNHCLCIKKNKKLVLIWVIIYELTTVRDICYILVSSKPFFSILNMIQRIFKKWYSLKLWCRMPGLVWGWMLSCLPHLIVNTVTFLCKCSVLDWLHVMAMLWWLSINDLDPEVDKSVSECTWSRPGTEIYLSTNNSNQALINDLSSSLMYLPQLNPFTLPLLHSISTSKGV